MAFPAWLEQLFDWMVPYVKNEMDNTTFEQMMQQSSVEVDNPDMVDAILKEDNEYKFLTEKFKEIDKAKNKEQALAILGEIVQRFEEDDPARTDDLKQAVKANLDSRFEVELAMPNTPQGTPQDSENDFLLDPNELDFFPQEAIVEQQNNELSQQEVDSLNELFSQWNAQEDPKLGALIGKLGELNASKSDALDKWLNQLETNQGPHSKIERIIFDLANKPLNMLENFGSDDSERTANIKGFLEQLQALDIGAINEKLQDEQFKDTLETKYGITIAEPSNEQKPPQQGLETLVSQLQQASNMAHALRSIVEQKMQSEGYTLENMNEWFETVITKIADPQKKEQVKRLYEELIEEYKPEQQQLDTPPLSDTLGDTGGPSILNQSGAGLELAKTPQQAAQMELAQQPKREPTPNEIIKSLNMGCRELSPEQFNEFQGLYKPTTPSGFMGMMSDALCASDLGKNLKGHDIEDIAKQSELGMLGAKQWVIQMRDGLGENRNEVEQQEIEAALQQYQQADKIHNFIRTVRNMARADTRLHEEEAIRRLDEILPDPAEGSKEAMLKQRLLEISQQVKHKQVYEPPNGQIGYATPKEKGFGKKRHLVYDDKTGQPKVGNHSNYTLSVNQDGHVHAKVFFDSQKYREIGDITQPHIKLNKHVARLDKTVAQMVDAAINEAGLGGADKPFEIKLFDPKNYELALVALSKIKEKAMLDGKEFHIKVPDPNQPGNTKTIKITPERGVSDDFKAYFAHMAQQQSVTRSGQKTRHAAGHYFINNENTKFKTYEPENVGGSGRHAKYLNANPQEYGEIFAKHIENRFDQLQQQCENRVEAAIGSQKSVVENQHKAEAKQEKRSRNKLN